VGVRAEGHFRRWILDALLDTPGRTSSPSTLALAGKKENTRKKYFQIF
jgi:hypothetical protein